VFRTVRGVEEAFRPGTERQREEERAPVAPTVPTGPQNYNDVIRREREEAAGLPPSTTPTPPPPTPQPPPAEDLSGLY
jgi:penicillin-binding protein 1A